MSHFQGLGLDASGTGCCLGDISVILSQHNHSRTVQAETPRSGRVNRDHVKVYVPVYISLLTMFHTGDSVDLHQTHFTTYW